MKKFAIFAVIFAMLMAFAGCTIIIGDDTSKETTEATTEATTEPEVTTEPEIGSPTEEELIEETAEPESDSDMPNAAYYDEMDWPIIGAATKIPTPDWSTRGGIYVDSESEFWADIGYSTSDDYNKYVRACQEAGFINDYYNMPGYMYYGVNDEGYAVLITNNEYSNIIGVQVTSDPSNWDRYWEDAE